MLAPDNSRFGNEPFSYLNPSKKKWQEIETPYTYVYSYIKHQVNVLTEFAVQIPDDDPGNLRPLEMLINVVSTKDDKLERFHVLPSARYFSRCLRRIYCPARSRWPLQWGGARLPSSASTGGTPRLRWPNSDTHSRANTRVVSIPASPPHPCHPLPPF